MRNRLRCWLGDPAQTTELARSPCCLPWLAPPHPPNSPRTLARHPWGRRAGADPCALRAPPAPRSRRAPAFRCIPGTMWALEPGPSRGARAGPWRTGRYWPRSARRGASFRRGLSASEDGPGRRVTGPGGLRRRRRRRRRQVGPFLCGQRRRVMVHEQCAMASPQVRPARALRAAAGPPPVCRRSAAAPCTRVSEQPPPPRTPLPRGPEPDGRGAILQSTAPRGPAAARVECSAAGGYAVMTSAARQVGCVDDGGRGIWTGVVSEVVSAHPLYNWCDWYLPNSVICV